MAQAEQVLKNVFGFSSFKDKQRDIIQSLLDAKDVLTLMPTGGGKSLCYQLPSIVRPGTGIVVSPLIALMEDQVNALTLQGVKAAYLNSSLEGDEQTRIEQAFVAGEYDLLYIAPERLLTGRMLSCLEQTELALFAIDEAHCVSQWGHDFRKEYQRLNILHERFPEVPRIALTATAEPRTRREIVDKLDLHQAAIYISSFDRPNIRYTITDGQNARNQLWRFISEEHPDDAGIVYCLSRKKVEDVAEWLCGKGRIALPYHAGLSAQERRRHQQRFVREEGVIIVATIAFGMGIDKPDVRFVAHLNLPKSIEAYYQETGRAGRDGDPADAWMSYRLQDVIVLRQMMQDSDANDTYKRAAGQKLEALLGLCEQAGCRRQALLGYFGETRDPSCGNCDNCLSPPETWDATLAARKALSAVYRTGQRFGVNYLVDVLCGKEDPRILRSRHDQLGVYGLGREFIGAEWRGIFRQLIALGYIEIDAEGHGALRLSDTCRELLRGEQSLALKKYHRPVRKVRRPAVISHPELAEADEVLFEALRELRRRLAAEQGVPPYLIFHDKTLVELVRCKPDCRESMRAINGVGNSKLDQYGDRFLDEIAIHTATSGMT